MAPGPWSGMRKDSGCVGIVGLGLIGGSLGPRPAVLWAGRCRAWCTVQATAERAMERGLVDAVSTDPGLSGSGCDLVILALPIPALLSPAPGSGGGSARDAVVTDVGSVKQPVLDTWKGCIHASWPATPWREQRQPGLRRVSAICSEDAPGSRLPMPAPIQRRWRWFEGRRRARQSLVDGRRRSARSGRGADLAHAGAGQCCSAAGGRG